MNEPPLALPASTTGSRQRVLPVAGAGRKLDAPHAHMFTCSQPLFLSEVAIMLWLVIRGATPAPEVAS